MENLNLIDIEELILSGNIVSAEKQIDDFLINHPNNPDLYYYKGLCILTTNKFTNSLEYFDKAIELDPKNNIKYKNSISNVYLKGGNTYYDLNDFDTANELYDKGLGFNNKSIECIFGKANISYKNGSYDECIKINNQILLINDAYAPSIFMIGACNQNLGNHSKAIEFYNKAIEISPKFLRAHIWLATMYLELDEFELSLATAKNAHMIDPDNIAIDKIIISNYLKLEKFDNVLSYLDTNYLNYASSKSIPKFVYGLKTFIRDIKVIKDYDDSYLYNPLEKINTFKIDKNSQYNAVIDKVDNLITQIKINNKSKIKQFWNNYEFNDNSIVQNYFINFVSQYKNKYGSESDLFFDDLSNNLRVNFSIVHNVGEKLIKGQTNQYSLMNGLFFFSESLEEIYKDLEISLFYGDPSSSYCFDKNVSKIITVENVSLILFPGIFNFRILSKEEHDYVFGVINYLSIK